MSLTARLKAQLLIYLQLTLCLLLAIGYGFLSSYYLPNAQPIANQIPPLSKRLVMVLVDGMRKDSANDAQLMPNLNKLAHEGVSGTAKTSSFPITIAALRAIGSGTPYSARDVVYNYTRAKQLKKTPKGKVRVMNKQGLDTSIDSLFDKAAERGMKIKLAGDEVWLSCFGNAISESFVSKGDEENPHGSPDDAGVQAAALKFLTEDDFDILIIHYQSVDRIGHNHTPLSNKYRKQVHEIDQYIGELTAQLPADATFFIFSDHGMSDTGWHGKLDNPPDIVTQAPFVFAKNRIANRQQQLSIDQIDYSPTLALLLGLPIPAQSEGTVVTDIFNLTDQERASLLIANLRARTNYLRQIEAATGIRLNLPPSQAEERFAAGDFIGATDLAKTELAAMNRQAELKTKYNISWLVRYYILCSIAAILLLYFTSTVPGIRWSWLVAGSTAWLVIAAVIAYVVDANTDLIIDTGNFLGLMLAWSICFTGYLGYQFARAIRRPEHVRLIILMVAIMLAIVLPNTATAINIMMIATLIGLLIYSCRVRRQQIALGLGLTVFFGLGWLMQQQFFFDNRRLRAICFGAALLFCGYCIKSFNRVPRAIFLSTIIVGMALTKIQPIAAIRLLSKFEAMIAIAFVGIALLIRQVKQQGQARAQLLSGGWGLLLLVTTSMVMGLSVIKDLSSSKPFLIALIAITLLLIKYLARRLLNGVELFRRGQLQVLLPAAMALMIALDARCLVHSQFKNQLGKIALCTLLIGLISWAFTPLKREVRIFLFHIFVITLAAIMFDPLHICFILLAIYLEVQFLGELVELCADARFGFETLYLLLSGMIYFTAYGNLSISSLFEEGRASILGAQITDFSRWNLSVIGFCLIAKFILVEMIMLLPLIQLKSLATEYIDQFARNLFAMLSFSIVIVIGMIWWQFAPGSQQTLTNLATALIFIGIKVIVATIGLLLITRISLPIKLLITDKDSLSESVNAI